MAQWDIVIRGGTVIDGSGRPGAIADVAIAGGRIAGIGPGLAGEAARVIDAAGLTVTPGFFDIKTHSDFVLPINPKAESKVRQGVTTEIIGHCGFSVAPVLPGKTKLLADYLSGGAPWLLFREVSFPDYLDTSWRWPPLAPQTLRDAEIMAEALDAVWDRLDDIVTGAAGAALAKPGKG